jgi:hypothetical protein
MKGIIPGMGALMTWTMIPGTRVQFSSWLVIILVQEAILVVILQEAILVIILVREARFLISLLKGHDPWYESPIFGWLLS